MWMTVDQTVYTSSTAKAEENWEGKPVVNLGFLDKNKEYHLNIDRATAARLINQLRKVLDA